MFRIEDESMTADLVALADREHIRELLHRYCFALDRGTVDDVMALFTDDCDLEIRPGELHRGRDAVYKWYEVLTRKRMDVLRHQAHNQVIELAGTTASSQSYWDVVGDLNGESMISAGFYEDTLHKTGEKWQFKKKVILIDYMGPLKEGWGGPRRIKGRLLGELKADTEGWR